MVRMKEKLLMLCYRAPYPLKSGSEIRMYQFIEILSEYYDITLLYLQEQQDEGDMQPLYEKCSKVQKFRVNKAKRCIQAVGDYLFCGQPLQAGYFYSREMQHVVDTCESEYKNILCMHVRTIQYMFRGKKKDLEKKNLYFDGIDAITMNYYNAYHTSTGIRKLINGMEYRRMAKYEKMVYGKVKNSILISQRDRNYIVDVLGVKCNPAVIYNYVIDYGYLPEVVKKKCTIAFMGKMDYAPNVDAVCHFVDNIFMQVKESYPQLQFQIIGGSPAEEVRKRAERDGVELMGFVDNPAELLQEATLVIAPMISGSGLQNKIVQSMYLGCTVVTTPIGADGLSEVTDEELVIAEDDSQMLEKLTYFLSEEADRERTQIGKNAREYISRNYSYEKIRRQITDLFQVKIDDWQ